MVTTTVPNQRISQSSGDKYRCVPAISSEPSTPSCGYGRAKEENQVYLSCCKVFAPLDRQIENNSNNRGGWRVWVSSCKVSAMIEGSKIHKEDSQRSLRTCRTVSGKYVTFPTVRKMARMYISSLAMGDSFR